MNHKMTVGYKRIHGYDWNAGPAFKKTQPHKMVQDPPRLVGEMIQHNNHMRAAKEEFDRALNEEPIREPIREPVMRELNSRYDFDPVKSKANKKAKLAEWQAAVKAAEETEKPRGGSRRIGKKDPPKPKVKREPVQKVRVLGRNGKTREITKTQYEKEKRVRDENKIRTLKNKIIRAEAKERKIEEELERARAVTKSIREELAKAQE